MHEIEEAFALRFIENVVGERFELLDVFRSRERTRAKRVRIGDAEFILNHRAVFHGDDDAGAEGLFLRIVGVIAARPLWVFNGRNLVPEAHRVRALGAFRRVGADMVPLAVLQGDRKNIHDRVVEGFPRSFRVHLLRIAGAGADDVMGVMRRMQNDRLHLVEIADFLAHAEGEIDQRLRLVFRRMFLGVGFKDGALCFTRAGERHMIGRVIGAFALIARGAAVEDERDHRVFAFIDRRRRALAPHATVDRFDGELASIGRRKGFPCRDFALARLARCDGGVQTLLHRLVDNFRRQIEQRAHRR